MNQRIIEAFSRIDEVNAKDPRIEPVDGYPMPQELIYGLRMTSRQQKFAPDASEVVQIACRAQHIARWRSPRSDYPMDRKGYHRWRTELGQMHAREASKIVRELGYDEDTVAQLRVLLTKQGIKSDPEVQLLEDVVCLVFLEHYFEAFAAERTEEKVLAILQKTWRKMSEAGQQAAHQLPLSEKTLALVERALSA